MNASHVKHPEAQFKARRLSPLWTSDLCEAWTHLTVMSLLLPLVKTNKYSQIYSTPSSFDCDPSHSDCAHVSVIFPHNRIKQEATNTLFPQQTFWSKNTRKRPNHFIKPAHKHLWCVPGQEQKNTTERFIKKVYCHISNPNIKVPVNCRTNSVKQTEHRANRSQQTHRQIHWFRTLERLLHQWSGSTTLTHVTDPTNVDSAEVQTVSRTARCGRYFCRII